MGEGGSGSVGGGVSGGNTTTKNIIDFLGSSWGQGGMNNPISTALISSVNDYRNAGALSDMLLGGRGFGKSRQYRQYNPVDPQYGFVAQQIPGFNSGQPTTNSDPKKPNPPAENYGPTTPGAPGYAPQHENSMATSKSAGGLESPESKASAPGAGGLPPSTPPPSGGVPGLPQTPAPNPYPGAPGEPGGPPLPNKDLDPRYPVGTRGYGPQGPLGPGQWDNGDAMEDPSYYDSGIARNGPSSNENWGINDDAPVPGEGLLGDIEGYGAWNDIDNRLKNDLGWQATGDLMDLEGQEKGMWDQFGKQNNLERASEDAIGWQRSGELSDLEQQSKHGYQNYANATGLENEVGDSWRGVSGPGQYDPLRGDTLEGMVKNPGFSASEKSSLRASQLLPIQSALEAQKLEGNARQAATGNAAGRWGASNAMALNAAGQAAQAGRNVELDSANMMRTDRAQGLSGLGDLQSQIDARKVQGAQGLQNLSGQQRQAGLASLQGVNNIANNQRAAQQFGIGAGMQLNDQQRGAQAQAAQGIGNLGQRQRANTQWGLGALSDLNKTKTDQQAQRIGMTNDMYKTQLDQGDQALNRLTGMATTAAGGYNRSDSQSANIGASV